MLNALLPHIQSIKISDIFDILIIALFIYMLLVWFRKSRARFMFIGMIAVVLIYVIARLAGLYMTTMALQAFFAVALIMVVVIFQDDFRHFFERIAIMGTTRKQRATTTFDEIADILSAALANLSRKRIGALVVVRGQDPLDRHLEAGINLDGVLSQILLETIFDRHVPSHDGAVIVDERRISMFGCHLPLSTNMKEAGRLGTRHAAGLGLSERADALCLIVSEEEGSISIAEDGRIRHLKDAAELNRRLKEFYNVRFPAKKGAGLSNFLTRNLMERILAVILAVALWMTFGHRTETIRRDFVVPIEYRNLAPNTFIKEPKPKDITITLSGPEQDFDIRKLGELKISMDAANIMDGENTLPITKDMVKSPIGCSVVNVDPQEITLNVYRIITVNIPVELKTVGHPPADIIVKDIRIEPKEVSVMVPSTVSREKVFVSMEPIDLKSINDTKTVKPKLIMTPEVRFQDDKIPDVKVVIEVEKKEKPDDQGKAR